MNNETRFIDCSFCNKTKISVVAHDTNFGTTKSIAVNAWFCDGCESFICTHCVELWIGEYKNVKPDAETLICPICFESDIEPVNLPDVNL
jgi:hypothetical protein